MKKKGIRKVLAWISEYTFSVFMLICLMFVYSFDEIDSIMGNKKEVRERFWDV